MSLLNHLSFFLRIVIAMYHLLRLLSLSDEKGFGLDSSFVTVERVPLVVSQTKEITLKRIN